MDEHGTGEPTQPYGAPQTYGGTPEVLDSAAPGPSVLPGSDQAAPGQAGQGHGRRTGIVAAVVVGALVVSGGAFAAWSRLNHSAEGPAQVLPSGTVAVLEVNLDPSAAQKVALVNLLRKLPGSSGLHGSDGSFQDWVGRTLSDGADSGTGNGTGSGSGLDFARDVQPWLGSHVAVAAVPSGQKSSPVDAVLVVQEKDDAAAEAAMDKLRAHGSPNLGYVVKDGYLVVTPDSRTGAMRVVTTAEKGSLADDAHFASDTASLGSEEVLTAWADASRLSDLLRQQLQSTLGGDAGSLGGVDPLGGLSGLGGSFGSLKGRFVMGLHATNDSVEMRVRSFGGTPAPASTPVRLRHVVADPVAVLAVSGYGKSLAAQWSTLSSSPMYRSLADQAKLIGLDLPGDLEKLLGDQLTASLSGRGLDEPQWVVAATSGDPAAGKAVLDRLLALAGPDAADLPVSTRVDGDTLYVGSSAGTVDGAATTDAADVLTHDELFQAAVANPGSAQTLVFVDLSKVWTLVGAGGDPAPAGLEHLKALGMTVTTDGADSDSTVRVIIR